MADTPATTPSTPASPAPAAPPASAQVETKPVEPVAAPVADKGKQDNPAPPATNTHREKLKALEAKLRGEKSGSPKPVEPAPAAPATPPQPEAKEPEPSEPTPDKPAPKGGKMSDDSIKVTTRDESGKDKEEEFSFEDCSNAILRMKDGLKVLRKLSKAEVLDVGSKWLLEQRKQDDFGRQMAQLREKVKGNTATKQDIQPTPEPAKAVQTPAPAAPSQPVSPTPSPKLDSPVALPQFAAEKLEQVKNVFGPDGAELLSGLLQETVQGVHSQFNSHMQTQLEQLAAQHQKEIKELRDREENLVNLQIERDFNYARDSIVKDFPQLKDNRVFEMAKRRANSLAPHYDNPWWNIPTIFKDACASMFGNEIAETEALKREESRKRQVQGQPTSVKEGNTAERSTTTLTRAQCLRAAEAALKAGDQERAKNILESRLALAG